MTENEQPTLVEFEGKLANPAKFEPPEVAGQPEATVLSVKFLSANPPKITEKSFKRKDSEGNELEVKRRAQEMRMRIVFDFPDGAKDTKGRELNKLGLTLRSDFGVTAYLDGWDGKPLEHPELFTMLKDSGAHKMGETGKLVNLCRASTGNQDLHLADLPALLTGKKVRVRNQPTINPAEGKMGPKIVITAILS